MILLASGFAAEFASSPAGWLTGLGTPLIASLVAFQYKTNLNRAAKLDAAMAQQTQALAVLVAESTHTTQTAVEANKKADSLTIAMAVLQSQLSTHERWHEKTERK